MPEALARSTRDLRPLPSAAGPMAGRIGSLAIRALYREVVLSPKPGLVSPTDSGSHQDMDFRTFLRSLQSLRDYFPAITRLGMTGPAFEPLRQLGVAAEAGMLLATGGINTHRGAIFNIGLLCAAAGALAAEGVRLSADEVCAAVSQRWGGEILGAADPAASSHGAVLARRYGCGGARREAAEGFPAALEVGLPAYREALRATGEPELAAIHSLFALVATLDDTNLLWRGGPAGLAFAQASARAFLADGSVLADDWAPRARRIHTDFVARNLSPGGSADLLGVTLFLDGL